MAIKTKMFLSSVAQDDFSRMRRHVFAELEALGHEPVMFEANMGPWTHDRDPIRQCLDAVRSSDIFLLFLKDKAGTYRQDAKRTITHLEFLQAFTSQKTILAFVDESVLSHYFKRAKRLIAEFTATYLADYRGLPGPEQLMEELSRDKELPGHVDPYVWFFLDDLVQRGIYCEPLSSGVSPDWKSYFSDLLRRGTLLLPLARDMDQNARLARQYADLTELASSLVNTLHIGGFRQIDRFLSVVRANIKSGFISKRYGEYIEEDVGELLECTAVTLYRQQDGNMLLQGKTGAADGEPFYPVEDQQSFVSRSYQSRGSGDYLIFYKEDKKIFYFCIPVKEYVMTLHFPAGGTWTAQTFMLFYEDIIHGIIDKNPLLLELIELILGGVADA
ncbi:hypothetical protein J31TS4_19450 [Paenibacillus sp. J31TS4]|uniref:DUF4062 domain-containing protein n=1 Tax=Paenibacillus sp. J31TS4 TaxID=2807195 RepID=UPI001B06E482|nr:DUF4062 domain-containing protein [Paenibacillus sp. J31TS4]GIP38665.1 hypothetical protein J31TS4_19450 [Paenibacillus sp. J31TS4]